MPPPPPPPPPGEPSRMDPYPEEPQASSSIIVIMDVINTITHLLLGAVAFSAIFHANLLSDDRTSSFSQHIYLCTTGYIILMSVAIMSFNPSTSWTRSLKHPQKKITHMLLQVIGSVLAITGSIIRISDRDTNFQTAHGILGLVAMVLTFLSLLGGVVNLLTSGVTSSFLITLCKTVHSCLGSLTIIVAFLCLCFGFNDSKNDIDETNVNISIALTVIAMCGIIVQPMIHSLQRIFK